MVAAAVVPRAFMVRAQVESALAERIPAALTLRPRSEPELFSTGIAEVDACTGGFPLGALSQICGSASSGRTSLMLALLREATRTRSCAVVDVCDSFDPGSARAAGIDLARLLWVRCSEKSARPGVAAKKTALDRLEQALKATDMLLQSGGFGMVVVDMADLPPEAARKVPLTSWFRFRRAVEGTACALVVLEQEPHAASCSSLVLRLSAAGQKWESLLPAAGTASPAPCCAAPQLPSHAQLFCGMRAEMEVTRSWKRAPAAHGPEGIRRKPAAPAFSLRTAWG